MYYARHKRFNKNFALRSEVVTYQLTTYTYFLNPTCRRRDGVKEDYYV